MYCREPTWKCYPQSSNFEEQIFKEWNHQKELKKQIVMQTNKILNFRLTTTTAKTSSSLAAVEAANCSSTGAGTAGAASSVWMDSSTADARKFDLRAMQG